MEVRHTGSFELHDEIKDMEYLGHLGALGADIIDQSVYAGEDWQAVHAAHAAFIQTLHRAYQKKRKIGRAGRAREADR